MNKDLYMTNDKYLETLERQKSRIEADLELDYWDSTVIGDKDTHNSWGLCSNDKEAWPEPELHLWPDQFENEGRVAPKYKVEHQHCPFDRRADPESKESKNNGIMGRNPMGCFYHCRFFSPKGKKRPNREEAVELYQEQIIRSENLLRKSQDV